MTAPFRINSWSPLSVLLQRTSHESQLFNFRQWHRFWRFLRVSTLKVQACRAEPSQTTGVPSSNRLEIVMFFQQRMLECQCDLWVIGLEQIEPRQRLNGICTEWMGHDGTNSATQRTRLRAVIKPVMVCKESTADHSAWKFCRQTFDYLTTGYVKLRKCSKKTLRLIPQWRMVG